MSPNLLVGPLRGGALSLSLVTGLVVCAAGGVAHAAEAQNLVEPKIGYVDMARALNEVEDGKTAKAKLKTEFDAKQKQLDKMQTDLRQKKEDFDKRVAVMKPEARATKQDELQQEMMQVQKVYMQLQQELVDSEGALTQGIRKKLQGLIDKIGDKGNYLLILNIGETVLYNKRHMDITDDVIRDYNKQFGKK